MLTCLSSSHSCGLIQRWPGGMEEVEDGKWGRESERRSPLLLFCLPPAQQDERRLGQRRSLSSDSFARFIHSTRRSCIDCHFDLRVLLRTWRPRARRRVPGRCQDGEVCQALQTGTCQVGFVSAQTAHWDARQR